MVASHFDIASRTVDDPVMAKTVNVVVTDDLDGSPDAETVAFSFNGQSYEIDLGQKNLAKLEKSLRPFIDAGRRAPRSGRPVRPGRPASARVDRAAVRAWAIAQGMKVSERGRISSEILRQYEATQ
jgi:Lsr2